MSFAKSVDFVVTIKSSWADQFTAFWDMLVEMAKENLTPGSPFNWWFTNQDGISCMIGNAPGEKFQRFLNAIPELIDLHGMPADFTVAVQTIRAGSFGWIVGRDGQTLYVRVQR
jgi:hypothetical protein